MSLNPFVNYVLAKIKYKSLAPCHYQFPNMIINTLLCFMNVKEYLQFKKKKKITNPDLQHHLSKRMWPFTNDDNDYGPFFEGKLMIS